MNLKRTETKGILSINLRKQEGKFQAFLALFKMCVCLTVIAIVSMLHFAQLSEKKTKNKKQVQTELIPLDVKMMDSQTVSHL